MRSEEVSWGDYIPGHSVAWVIQSDGFGYRPPPCLFCKEAADFWHGVDPIGYTYEERKVKYKALLGELVSRIDARERARISSLAVLCALSRRRDLMSRDGATLIAMRVWDRRLSEAWRRCAAPDLAPPE